ncbi:MAG: AsmA family protein [Rhodospirillales bacterium]
MRVTFAILAGLFVIAVSGALVAPSFVDWNAYKAQIEAQAEKATGRKLTISGDISATLLPAPALSVEGVVLANVKGGRADAFLRLKSADVQVALGPLLSGAVQVTTVRLEEPVLHLEKYKNGANWEFELLGGGGDAAAAGASGASGAGGGEGGDGGDGGPAEVRLDDFTIENGTLVYYDAVTGNEERVENISANIRAASLAGPFEIEGELTARALPLTFDITAGQIVHGRTVAVNAEFGAGGDTELSISGTAAGMTEEPRFKGRIKGEGDNLSALIARLSGGAPAAVLSNPFSLDAEVQADMKSISLSRLTLNVGDETLTGGFQAELGDTFSFSAELNAGRIDADALMGMKTPAAQNKDDDDDEDSAGADSKSGGASAPVPSAAIPPGVNGSLSLAAEAVIFKGEKIGPVRLNAEIGDGEITVSQLSASTPGGGDIAVFGFITMPKGKPLFDGDIEANIADLRAVMKWLDIAPPPVAHDRLRTLSYSSSLAVTPEQVQLSGVKLAVDASNITGGVTVALRKRPSFGADLAIDKINLDAYLPQSPGAGAKTAGGGADGGASGGGAGAKASPLGALSALSALNSFDANLKLRAGQLTYGKTPVKGVRLDATIVNGAVTIRDFSVKQAAGAQFALKGGLSDLSGLPKVKDLNIKFNAPKLAPVFALAGREAPPAAVTLGAVGVNVTLNGPISAPSFSAAVEAAGGRLTGEGKAAVLDPSPSVSVRLSLEHADPNALFKRLGGYRPSGRLGPVKLSAAVTAGQKETRIEKIEGAVGGVKIAGAAAVRHNGEAKPSAEISLRTTGVLDLAAFMPAQQTAGAWPEGAAGQGPARRKARTLSRRWSKDPIDVSALHAADVKLTLKSEALAHGGFAMKGADIAASLTNGVFRTERVKGTVFGGAFGAQASFDAGKGEAAFETSLTGADIAAALQAAAGAAPASGRAAVAAKLTTRGKSPADFVSALNGAAKIQLSGVDARQSAEGSPLAGLLDIARGLGGMGSAVSKAGGKGGSGLADISASFTVEKGVAVTKDLKIASGLGDGAGAGAFDLPAWRMDMKGEITPAAGGPVGLLTGNTEPVPFRIHGPIDAPKLEGFDIGNLLSRLIPKNLKDKKGISGFLDVLGGALGAPKNPGKTQQKQPQQQPAQQQPQEKEAPKKKEKVDPLGAIMNILGGN